MHGRPSVWVESHTFCAYFFCSCGLTTLSLPSFENYWPLTLVKNWHWRSALMTRASERIVGRWSYPAVKKKFSRIWTGARQFVTSLQTQTYLYLMLRHNRFHWWVLDYLLIDCGFVRVLTYWNNDCGHQRIWGLQEVLKTVVPFNMFTSVIVTLFLVSVVQYSGNTLKK